MLILLVGDMKVILIRLAMALLLSFGASGGWALEDAFLRDGGRECACCDEKGAACSCPCSEEASDPEGPCACGAVGSACFFVFMEEPEWMDETFLETVSVGISPVPSRAEGPPDPPPKSS
jgi:hypothetical protein